jgi:hypothetical protein
MFQPPQSLVDAVAERTLVPFIGAGVSVGAVHDLEPKMQFPDWKGLIGRLATRLRAEGKPAFADQVEATIPNDTMVAAQLAMDNLGRPLFLDVMKDAFGRVRKPIGANLSATQAIWQLQAPFLITTNYDLALEWPLDPTQIQRIHNDDPSELLTLDRKDYPLQRIWHLHGSINRIDTVILTSDQYRLLYPDETSKARTAYENAFNQFEHLLATRHFLFIGFSLAEPVLRKKLADVMAKTVRTAPLKYLLLRAGEADAAEQTKFLENYNVQVIEFEDFGAPMVEAIDRIHRAAFPGAPSVSGLGLTAEMEHLVDDLLTRVVGLAISPRAVARMYFASKPDAWSPLPIGGDGIARLREAIVLLGSAVTRAESGVPPLLDFADRLASEALEPWPKRLRTWLDGAATQLGFGVGGTPPLGPLIAAARTAEVPGRAQVLVRIQPSATGTDQWLVHAWLYVGARVPEALFGAEGQPYKAGSSGQIVYELLEELEARYLDPDLTSIAFIVPSVLACDAIHGWRLPASVADDPPIGVKYMVTVRSLERLERAPMIRQRFRQAWNDLKKRATEVLAVLEPNAALPAGAVAALFLDAASAKRPDLATILQKQGARCVVLREPPCATALDHLSAVLNTTTPAIVWCEDITAATAVEREIRDLLQSVPIADLPRRIREERATTFAAAGPTGGGSKLTLLWDDADYVPPDQDPNAKARLETT